ncbi:GTPase ObgE [unidentified eubacterium SCB49]|nr:GTPase ObgE [unidentified eubacterium SCB49]
MKLVCFLVVATFLISCGAVVQTDYEKGVNWTENKTYQFYTEMKSGLNDLDEKRVAKAIDSTLKLKRFKRADYSHYLVAFFVEETISNSRNTIGIGLGSGGGGISVGGNVGIPIGGKVVNQRMTIEVRESTEGGRLVWQAVYDGELKEQANPKQKEAYYNKVIPLMLKDFPPEK